jgi:hypothetical protein
VICCRWNRSFCPGHAVDGPFQNMCIDINQSDHDMARVRVVFSIRRQRRQSSIRTSVFSKLSNLSPCIESNSKPARRKVQCFYSLSYLVHRRIAIARICVFPCTIPLLSHIALLTTSTSNLLLSDPLPLQELGLLDSTLLHVHEEDQE